MRKYASHLGRRLNSNQRGAILIWFIFILVAAGIFGSSMVYLTTSSTYDELLANNQARAYYLAEAGGRFAIPQVIDSPKTASINLDKKTFTLPLLPSSGVGDEFHLSVDVDVDPIVITSTGIVNADSWLEGKRTITYEIVNDFLFDTPFDDAPAFSLNWDIMDGDFAEIFSDIAQTGGKPAVRFKNLGTDYKIAIGLNWVNNPAIPNLAAFRADNDNLLSYEIQVKMKLDSGVSIGNRYMSGLLFRYDSRNVNDASDDFTYGISIFKYDVNAPGVTPPWAAELHPDFDALKSSEPLLPIKKYIVLWKKGPDSALYELLYHQELDGSYNVIGDEGDGDLNDWSTIVVRVIESGNKLIPTSYSNEIFGYVQGEETPAPESEELYLRGDVSWDYDGIPFNQVIKLPPPTDEGFDDDSNKLTTATSETVWTVPPSPPPLTGPHEMGIHTFFDNQGNNNIFFEDFSMRLLAPNGRVSITPIQH